ncbi:isoprenylcysteine carboxylmethyltransferase family protein [Phenylobacterium sp.]|jgi:protein-S-isoprenylcysteine O-methyltransferase Ste14|uniref:methyltransferase family protein n=1 Tax=Phenylobacterium sp. TaxID=1871053 RepID=UPI002E30EBCA|nr:isoprenylcysteine carboxylmethyltransferase family protein [Phenylobacterium sp.]HEX3363847.1 isoprenylcysteine carboxylmethyltransferase family protein [Phenylobacterium sp.]
MAARPRLIGLLLVEMVLLMAVLGGLLFGAAGTLLWPSAWAYLALFFALGMGVSLWLARVDPGLLEERLKPVYQRDQKAWDKVFLTCVIVLYVGWTVLMGIDARRMAWSHVPVWLQTLGAALLVVSFLGVAWVFATNSFAAPVIKIQADRGQTVIDTGPYAIVRHPMYAFGLLQFVGAPLVLGSWWGLILVPPAILGLTYRTLGEEKMLREELAGYDDYARRVRWRYAPGVW